MHIYLAKYVTIIRNKIIFSTKISILNLKGKKKLELQLILQFMQLCTIYDIASKHLIYTASVNPST